MSSVIYEHDAIVRQRAIPQGLSGDCGKLKNWKYTGVTECTGEEQKGVCELVGLDIVVVCGIE